VLKRADVLGNRGFEVLLFGEVKILTARIAQQVAEQVDATPTFPCEVDFVDGPVHLSLKSGRRLESHDEWFAGTVSQLLDPLAQDRIAALVAQLLQLLANANRRDVRVSRQ
jgi:hypothetical protein